ncbi:hypothetical protein pqer_cds_968 [Pandoravirus quercus]|uniref:Uncharacterized protein n=2 Tax=Pandoravirus TaxID=2060084 RepID=A0A2U7UAI1_9VIRU|nr:hypothetical protein pqer_cds_968 [Pandoravirus quercus]AVK75390.1 hypothetical protein pqer_cds_968 [Pandoravirus quercus]QBZ81568.1 hypothetical protein pclt_cds_982 [Pandoravirus celtis]
MEPPNRRGLPLARRQILGPLARPQPAPPARLPPPVVGGPWQPLPVQAPPLGQFSRLQAVPIVRPAPTQPRVPAVRAAPLGRFVRAQVGPAARPAPAQPVLQRSPIQQAPPLGRFAVSRPAPTTRPVPIRTGRPTISGVAAAGAPQQTRTARQVAPTARFAPSLPLLRGPAPVQRSWAPTLVSPHDDGCVPGHAEDLYALLRAIAEQDDSAIRDILANGRVNVNEWIDPDIFGRADLDIHNRTYVEWPTQAYNQWTDQVGDQGEDERLLSDTELATTRGNSPDSLLGMAVLTGAPRSVETLIDAGALPRPTREFFLNSALSRLNASYYYTPGGQYARKPVDALGTAAVLLRRFGRSPRLHPLDMNPLSVARLTLQRSPNVILGNNEDAVRSVDVVLVPLLAAGYSPGERIRAVGPPPVLVTDSRRRFEYTPAYNQNYGSPADYNVARAALARITERQAIGSGGGEPIAIAQYTGPDSSLEVLSRLWDSFTTRVADLYNSLSPPEQDVPITATAMTGEEEDEQEQAQDEAESMVSLIESLPPEVVEMIAASRGLSARDVAALYAASRRLAAAATGPLAQRRAEFMGPGAPCGDYAGCMATLLAAIARDDSAAVRRVLQSRVIGLDDLLDPSADTLYGNPLTVVTTKEPADGRLGFGSIEIALRTNSIGRSYAGGRLLSSPRFGEDLGQRGWNYATPLALAVIAKAPDVVRELAAAGAQPWPSVESLLERALNRPFDERLFALGVDMTRYESMNALIEAQVNEAIQLDNDEPLPRVEQLGPHATVLIREADTPAVVRAIVESYPRSVRFHHGDANPLTVLRLFALESLNEPRFSPPNPTAIEAMLAPLIDVLLEAGYSPDERGLPCDADPEGTTERALVAEWAATESAQSREGILADIFGRAYVQRDLPPLVSPDSL